MTTNSHNQATALHRSVLVLSGLPGSGKTTYARELALRLDPRQAHLYTVSADAYFTDAKGVYTYRPADIGRAHAACFRRFLTVLQKYAPDVGRPVDPQYLGVPVVVVVDNTNTTALESAPYMLAAAAHDFQARIVRVRCPIEVAVRRNIHQVPLDALERMAAALEQPLPPWWDVIQLDVALDGTPAQRPAPSEPPPDLGPTW